MVNVFKRFFLFIYTNTGALVFVAVLDALAWLILSGNDTAFIHPRFQIFLVLAAVILFSFLYAFILSPFPIRSHHIKMEQAMSSLVLFVPILFLYTASGQGLGAHALSKKYMGTGQQVLSQLLSPGDDVPPDDMKNHILSLLDIARHMKSLDHQRIKTQGFVYRDQNVPKNYLMLFRFAIFCCAADAVPVVVLVEEEDLSVFETDTWIEVEGMLTLRDFNGNRLPVIRSEKITISEAPPAGARYLFF